MKSVRYVVKEHYENRGMIYKLAKNEVTVFSAGTSLGYWWTLVKDVLFFLTYSMFMVLLSNSTVEGFPRLVYLAPALIPWYFISASLSSGANAVRSKGSILTKIKFPLSIVPTFGIISIFYQKLASFSIVFVVLAIYGYLGNINILMIMYYFIAMFILMVVLNLTLSTFVALSKDFSQIYSTIVKISFYFVPVLWSFEIFVGSGTLMKIAEVLLKLNPFTYIILGMRDAFLVGSPIDVWYTIYFWCFVLVAFLIGCFVQYKIRRVFVDFL